MEKSFRDILANLLEVETAAQTSTTTEVRTQPSTPLYEFPFTWSAPRPQPAGATAAAAARIAYPAPTPKKAAPTPKPTAKPEVLTALTALTAADRPHVDTLIRLGASELNEGVSTARLRKAYRRLAKKLHPDLSPGTALLFMELKKAYAALSASGCGSESASASKTQRPNAA